MTTTLLRTTVLAAAVLLAPADASAQSARPEPLRAVRLASEIILDGQLDEGVYRDAPPHGHFVQQEPTEGAPATERTEVWIHYDDAHLHIAARCWDSQPGRLVANEMRRDNPNIEENDSFSVALDPFYERRNGVLFHTNALGGLYDALIIDEATINRDWNTVWDVKTARFDGGWTLEMVIPFQSLRYRASGDQVWGINFRRTVRWKNERSFLAPVPREWKSEGINKLSLAAPLIGIEIPRGSNLREVKPYALAGLLTDRTATPARVNDWTRNAGGDVKLGVTRGLTLDLTVNTDFAQVESDDQQVNLTRFNLFFPEKREFFLEGQGIFAFAGSGGGRADTPLLFFSRRIGLHDNATVPIRGGARLSGRAGPYAIGLLTVRQDESDSGSLPATTFSVARVKRDIQRRGNIGAILVHRSASELAPGDHVAAGADARFWLTDAVNVSGYFAQTMNADDSTGASYRAQLEYTGDRFGTVVDFVNVDPDFTPEAGYVRRQDLRRAHTLLRYTHRPNAHPVVRNQEYTARLSYFTDTRGHILNRDAQFHYELNFNSGDDIELRYVREFERVDEGFTVAGAGFVPAGDYTANEVRAAYEFGPQRRSGGELAVTRGTFYGGARTALESQGRLEVTPRISVEPRLELNWIDLPVDRFRTSLFGSRLNFTLTPRMLIAGLLQYNSTNATFDTNLRLRWEYTPGSEFFVVFSDGRATDEYGRARVGGSLRNRTYAVKITRLVRF